MRGVVFGGLDGILTTFAACCHGRLKADVVVTHARDRGLDGAGDALSMAAGEYLSAKAEDELGCGGDADEPGPLEKESRYLALRPWIAAAPRMLAGASSSFQTSISITGGTLFALGAIKSQFGIGVWWRAGVEVAGRRAAAVAYFARAVERWWVSRSVSYQMPYGTWHLAVRGWGRVYIQRVDETTA